MNIQRSFNAISLLRSSLCRGCLFQFLADVLKESKSFLSSTLCHLLNNPQRYIRIYGHLCTQAKVLFVLYKEIRKKDIHTTVPRKISSFTFSRSVVVWRPRKGVRNVNSRAQHTFQRYLESLYYPVWD